MNATAAEAAQVVALLQSGMRQSDVAQQPVRRVFQWYQKTGGFIQRRGSERQRCTSERDDRYIVLTSLHNQFSNSSSAQLAGQQ